MHSELGLMYLGQCLDYINPTTHPPNSIKTGLINATSNDSRIIFWIKYGLGKEILYQDLVGKEKNTMLCRENITAKFLLCSGKMLPGIIILEGDP